MQAFAKNTEEKPIAENKEDALFSADELIFPDENVERPYTRYGYKVSEMNFLVPEMVVSEVIQEPNIFNLPNSPYWIEGLVNIRGNIVPVMNIGKFLKQASAEKVSKILVINSANDEPAIAVIIEDLPTSLEINDTKTSASKYPNELQSFVSDGFKQNNEEWVEFNPQKLFKQLANKE